MKENNFNWDTNNFGMKRERYKELMRNFDLELTNEEFAAGWHFCKEWDFLLIHDTWEESECCICLRSNTNES